MPKVYSKEFAIDYLSVGRTVQLRYGSQQSIIQEIERSTDK